MRRNPDERLRRRARDLAAGAGTMDDRLAQEAAILRTEGLAWRTRVPHFLGVEWDSNEDPLVTLDNDRKAHDDRGVIERYLVNKLILGDYDQREAWLLFLGLTQKHRRRLMIRQGPSAGMFGQAWGGRAANEFLARFLDEARAMWTPDDLGFVLARPLVDPWPLVPAGVQRDWKKLGLDVFKGMPRQNPSPDQRRRELERRAALGDPEAAAQLEAMIHRAPATPGEAIEAGDPVRLAWQAWQEGRGTLGEYEAARLAEAVPDLPSGTRAAWAARGAALRGGSFPRDMYDQDTPRSNAALVLDTPQADAVLQAYDHATGKPWQSALSYSGWGRRAKPTVAQAYQIVRAYYESLGYHQDGMAKGYTGSFAETIGQGRRAPNRMPTLISGDGARRVVFSRTTVRREVGGRGRWQRDYSRDPADQVGIIALAEALMRRALRAKDWRANPDGMQLARDWRAAARADDAAGHNDAAQFWRDAAAGAFLASNPPPGPTICAWCPLYGRPPAVIVPGDPAQPASHGLCAACKADMKAGRATGAPGSPAP